MNVLSNLQDKLAYGLHSLTYDPAAEEYAASKRAAEEAAAAAAKAKTQKEAAELTAKEKEVAEKERAAKEAKERAERSQFSFGRFFGKVTGTVFTILLVFLAVVGCFYGAHLATNLNLYRSWPYRLLYAVYGFVFFPVVILYVLGYRWWWKGKKPRYYALLPLIPYYINHPLLASFFSWLSYKPDDAIEAYQEWNPAMVEKGEEIQQREAVETDIALDVDAVATDAV
jgi:hypothetical protein